jgi:hypothetical protein
MGAIRKKSGKKKIANNKQDVKVLGRSDRLRTNPQAQ